MDWVKFSSSQVYERPGRPDENKGNDNVVEDCPSISIRPTTTAHPSHPSFVADLAFSTLGCSLYLKNYLNIMDIKSRPSFTVRRPMVVELMVVVIGKRSPR